MSTPPLPTAPGTSNCVKREDWDRCVRNGTWRVALGVIVGAIGSAFLVSEIPMMVGAGLGVGWAVRHCKNILRSEPKTTDKKKEDPCSCCYSDYEALDKNEFDQPNSQSPTATPNSPTHTQDYAQPFEEQCTCNEVPSNWSPPRPADPSYNHPRGCSCYN